MKTVFKLLLWTLAAVLLSAVLLVWLALNDRPLVRRDSAMTAADVARVRDVLGAADPRKHPQEGEAVRTFHADGRDLDLILHDASRRLLHGAGRVVLADQSARIQLSVQWPRSPVGQWLNVEADVRQTAGLPALERLQIGRVPVPPGLARWLLVQAIAHYEATEQVQTVVGMVQRVTLQPTEIVLDYVWRPDGLRTVMLPVADQQRLRSYVERLPALLGKGRGPVPLASLLPPMFDLARVRTAAVGGGDQVAAQENRSALIALALYATGQSPARFVPEARHWNRPVPRPVLVRGREDFAMHFLVSAVLAAEGGGRLADAIGLYKEISDSRGGSGFSFNDIAADRAGTRFGQIAANDPKRLQADLSKGVTDEDFMPGVADLPEFLNEAEFKATYGGVGAPAYERMKAEIERRVASRPLLR
ncbi:hypothetical protein [Sphaerotilus sp.]|uniref:hypothetical protein n=1 Tax=Sphaerotilus sp. TaxID=2093942 RepID=UPI002ACEAEC9|nr:hypothetical protein [Sphaerotilus sp.]MDZ7856745.1 hypothetical protein [Sphaerotilus sp.]